MALILRIGFVLVWRHEYSLPDEQSYISVASNLLLGRGFEVGPKEKVGRAPLYPLFLAANFLLFGQRLAWVRLAQAVAGAMVCVPAFLLARRLHSDLAGVVAAAICAVYPPYVFYSRLILSEALFIPLLPAIVLACMSLAERGGWLSTAGAGVGLGASILLRPSSLLLWPTLLAVVWLVEKNKHRLSWQLIVASIAVMLCLLPWVVRNYGVTGRIVLTTLTDGWALYEGNSPEATGGPAQHLVAWPLEEMQGMDEYERNAFLRQRAIRYVVNHPLQFVRLTAVRLARMWNPVPNDLQFRTPLILACSALSYVCIVVAAALAVFLPHGRSVVAGKSASLMILFWPVVYYGLVHAVTVGSVRYRDPLMYALVVLCAGGVAESWMRWSIHRSDGENAAHGS